jgi:SAM-dependent methyltransferase
MKRLAEQNINTPEWFNHVWKLENVHRYDAVRMRAFLQGVKPEDRVLDVGAGWWGVAQYATANSYPGRYTALDFSEEACRRTLEITPMLNYRIGDALAMPFAADTFHRVCCGELIEHMERPQDLVAELVRVCEPGGKVIIGTLNDKCDAAIAHGEYPEHLWSFTPDDLVGFLAPYGSTTYWEVGHYHFVACLKLPTPTGRWVDCRGGNRDKVGNCFGELWNRCTVVLDGSPIYDVFYFDQDNGIVGVYLRNEAGQLHRIAADGVAIEWKTGKVDIVIVESETGQ